MEFENILDRIREATGARTQVQLADILGIRQSSISDAKRRNSVPADWMLKLYRTYQLNPDWLEHGDPHPKHLAPADGQGQLVRLVTGLEELNRDEVRDLAKTRLTGGDLMDLLDQQYPGRSVDIRIGGQVMATAPALAEQQQ